MAVVEVSREVVEERLGALEEAYPSFTVNQTTLSVCPEAYDRARERCRDGVADVYVQVHNEADDVLLVEGHREWTVPSVRPPTSQPIEVGTRRVLADRTGVQCRITDLERVTILGIRHEDDADRETVYRLVVVFAAERVAGSPDSGVAWHAELPSSAGPAY